VGRSYLADACFCVIIAYFCHWLDLHKIRCFACQMQTLSKLRQFAMNNVGGTEIPRLAIHKIDQPTELTPLIYDPSVCLILQGAKRTVIGDQVINYGTGSSLVVAAELPAMGQVLEASAAAPFLAIVLTIDPAGLAEAIKRVPTIQPNSDHSYGVEPASDLLLESWGRFVSMLERPGEIPALASLCEQELLYRLLMGPNGTLLHQIGASDTVLARIRTTMDYIRTHHAERIEVSAMADLAGMSLTTFHRRFKAVTGVSPLQYLKQIRLHEAKRCLVAKEGSAASIAFRVGYESASQFSREYRRMFGLPPAQDAAAARELAKVAFQI
jgi:AraC-like DNA-binding protein